MQEEDSKYEKYLEKVFEAKDDYYYINLETKEVIPEHMSVVRIDEATLDYVYHYDILQDIEGNLITEDEVTRVFDCSKGIITYQKPGYVVVMKNLITGEKIYESDYYSLVLASKDGYNLLRTYLGNNEYYEYVLINPRGEKVFKTKSLEISYSIDNFDGFIRLYQKGKDYIDFKEKMVLARGYKLKKSSRIYSVEECEYTKEVEGLLDKFKISKEIKIFVKRYLEIKNRMVHLRYNDMFLEVLLTGKDEERAIIATLEGKILYNDRIEYFYLWRIESEFNDEIIMIPSSLDIHNNISYYDAHGSLISRFFNVSGSLWVDKTLANLYKLGKITNLGKEKSYSGRGKLSFKVGERILKTQYEFKDNRLKVTDEKGLFGFIDDNGEVVIEPQYYEADNFYYGTAKVKRKNNNEEYIEVIDINGEVLSKDDDTKRKEFNRYYSGTFKMPYTLSFSKQLEYTNYKEAKDFWKNDVYYYYDIRDSRLLMSKYELVRQYENYLVYLVKKTYFSEKGYYVVDKRTGEKTFLGPLGVNTRFCDEYFVVDDITYYPKDELINLGHFNLFYRQLKKGIRLVSKDEYLKNRIITLEGGDSKEKKREEEKALLERQRADLLRKKKENAALEQEKANLLAKIKEVEAKQHHLHILHSLAVPGDFYVELNGYKVINPKYIKELKDYDLLTYDFSNFSLKGVNFKGTNAAINPQNVYNKDISGADLSDVTLLSYDFRDVNMEETTFTNEFVQMYQESVLKLKKKK